MIRELEDDLWQFLLWNDSEHDLYCWPRDWAGPALLSGRIQSVKQMWATLEKWTAKGWYEYGVSLDCGWVTEKGRAEHDIE
jgi:hypothetical protein